MCHLEWGRNIGIGRLEQPDYELKWIHREGQQDLHYTTGTKMNESLTKQ
jgi:hypothetical protein